MCGPFSSFQQLLVCQFSFHHHSLKKCHYTASNTPERSSNCRKFLKSYQLHLHFIHSSAWRCLQKTKLRANRSCLRTDRGFCVKTVGASKAKMRGLWFTTIITTGNNNNNNNSPQSSPVQVPTIVGALLKIFDQLPTANADKLRRRRHVAHGVEERGNVQRNVCLTDNSATFAPKTHNVKI